MGLKQFLKASIKKYKRFRSKFSKVYYLSIGENCLTDHILERHHIKSFSTPYSHGRSNLDYAIHLEKEGYADFLKPTHLYYAYVGDTKVVRNRYYAVSDAIYTRLHQNGFEFTHHDVIGNTTHAASYQRKVDRMIRLTNDKCIKFLYHYRLNDHKNLAAIIEKAEIFLSYYKAKGISCEFIFFTQELVCEVDERGLEHVYDLNAVRGFVFKTMAIWGGDDPDLLWAISDDDLIRKMIKKIK